MHLLQKLLRGGHPRTRDALNHLWDSLPDDPAICWYPSAGSCFRDLLIWNHYPALAEVPEPDLFIHTDYSRPSHVPHDHDDGRTRITLQIRERLEVSPEIHYEVDPAFASHAGAAAERPVVELLQVLAESKTTGTIEKPVLYFHFENFNWFEEFVLERGLRFSHMFKLREGCGFGGARTSVSNLYPLLAQVGCRYLVADQEIHLNESLLRRYLSAFELQNETPFVLQRSGPLGELSDMHVEAFRVQRGAERTGWIDDMFQVITRGSPWEHPRARKR